MVASPEARSSLTSFLMMILAVASLLAVRGKWSWAFTTVIGGVVAGVVQVMMQERLPLNDRLEIRFNILSPSDVLYEMIQASKTLKEKSQLQPASDKNDPKTERARLVILEGLYALAKKFGRRRAEAAASSSSAEESQPKPDFLELMEDNGEFTLSLLCLDAAYVGLESLAEDDAVVAAALSLLALVAKEPFVRLRLKQDDSTSDKNSVEDEDESQVYLLEVPIRCMRQALERAQQVDESDTDRAAEQACAELQRKGCLLLGALADGDLELSKRIVAEGGLDAIVQALDWYRFHSDVANWALWAIFILCFENSFNKYAVVQAGVVPLVIQTLRNIPDSEDVARHGVAILFDLMRDDPVPESSEQQPALDVWRIRQTALSAGLHGAIVNTMTVFPNAMDIHMMGAEILAGTDYQGTVPPPYSGRPE